MPRPKAQPGSPAPSQKRRRLSSREGAVTTSLALPRTLHKDALMAAIRLNWTFAEVVREALAEWLKRHDGKGGRR